MRIYSLFNFLTNGFETPPADFYFRKIIGSDLYEQKLDLLNKRDLEVTAKRQVCLGRRSKVEYMMKEWSSDIFDKILKIWGTKIGPGPSQ